MLKQAIKGRLGKKIWGYAKIGLIVIAIVLVGYTLWQVFTPNSVPQTPTSAQVREFTEHRLVAIPNSGMLGGVLAGFAYYFAFPLWLLRILFVLAVITLADSGISDFLLLAYILCWIFMPTIDFIPADFVVRAGG